VSVVCACAGTVNAAPVIAAAAIIAASWFNFDIWDFLLWRRNHKCLFRIVCKVTTASLCLEFDLDTMLARSLAAKRAAK